LDARGGTHRSNGDEVSTYQHAWAVVFLIDDGNGDRIHCSGSIIDPTHIITAAHCFYPKEGGTINTNKLTVVVGANDPFGAKRRERGIKHKIKRFYVHDKYDSDTRAAYYDIAIVEVEKVITFGSNIWPICIPERVDTNQNKFKRQTVTVIGYGPMHVDDAKDRTGEVFFYLGISFVKTSQIFFPCDF
jgi:secreted trypsin-like serine protease